MLQVVLRCLQPRCCYPIGRRRILQGCAQLTLLLLQRGQLLGQVAVGVPQPLPLPLGQDGGVLVLQLLGWRAVYGGEMWLVCEVGGGGGCCIRLADPRLAVSLLHSISTHEPSEHRQFQC